MKTSSPKGRREKRRKERSRRTGIVWDRGEAWVLPGRCPGRPEADCLLER